MAMNSKTSKSIKKAVKECAGLGDNGRCLYEMYGKRCIVPLGGRCPYFEKAVLPAHPEAEIEYRKEFGMDADIKIKSCAWCGSKFAPKTNRSMYCSLKCRIEGRKYHDRQRKRKSRH